MAVPPQINDQNANVSLFCKGQTIKVHKIILMQNSMFFVNQMRTARAVDGHYTVCINDKCYDDVLAYVKFLYELSMEDVTISEGDWHFFMELQARFGDDEFDTVAMPDLDSESGETDIDESTSASDNEDGGTSESEPQNDSVQKLPTLNTLPPVPEKITILKNLLSALKQPDSVKSCYNKMPDFNECDPGLVADLMLREFIASQTKLARIAHLEFYDMLQNGRNLFGNVLVDIKSILVTKVEHLFAQNVIARCEEEVPKLDVSEKSVPFDEEVAHLLRQQREDVRNHSRAIVCLFSEFFLKDWIAYRTLEIAISGLLDIATNEKLEYLCQLLSHHVEKKMQKKRDESGGLHTRPAEYLTKIGETISKLFAEGKISSHVKTMFRERKDLKNKIKSYGIVGTYIRNTSTILDHAYWIRHNIATINADQYYQQSGGISVKGLDSAVRNVANRGSSKSDTSGAPKANVRVIQRDQFFKTMKINREMKAKADAEKQQNNNSSQQNGRENARTSISAAQMRASTESLESTLSAKQKRTQWFKEKQATKSNNEQTKAASESTEIVAGGQLTRRQQKDLEWKQKQALHGNRQVTENGTARRVRTRKPRANKNNPNKENTQKP